MRAYVTIALTLALALALACEVRANPSPDPSLRGEVCEQVPSEQWLEDDAHEAGALVRAEHTHLGVEDKG